MRYYKAFVGRVEGSVRKQDLRSLMAAFRYLEDEEKVSLCVFNVGTREKDVGIIARRILA